MLNYRLDPVKSNAAAFLQHLTYKNDKVRMHSSLECIYHCISTDVNGHRASLNRQNCSCEVKVTSLQDDKLFLFCPNDKKKTRVIEDKVVLCKSQ